MLLVSPQRTLQHLGDFLRPVQHRECYPRYEVPAVARKVGLGAEGVEEGGRDDGREGRGHGWCGSGFDPGRRGVEFNFGRRGKRKEGAGVPWRALRADGGSGSCCFHPMAIEVL